MPGSGADPYGDILPSLGSDSQRDLYKKAAEMQRNQRLARRDSPLLQPMGHSEQYERTYRMSMTESPYVGRGQQAWTGDRIARHRDASGLSDIELRREIARLRRACGDDDEDFRGTSRARTSSLGASYASPNSRLAPPTSSMRHVSNAGLFGRSPRAPLLDAMTAPAGIPLQSSRLNALALHEGFDSEFDAIRHQEQHLADISARKQALEAYLKND